MNTKVITFSVFAILFLGSALGCYEFGHETLANTSMNFSIAFVVAAFLLILTDVCKNLKLCCLNRKLKGLKAEIEEVRSKIENKEVPDVKVAPIETVAAHNEELRIQLGSLSKIGEVLNKIQEELKKLETA
jgi:hypothetical protein